MMLARTLLDLCRGPAAALALVPSLGLGCGSPPPALPAERPIPAAVAPAPPPRPELVGVITTRRSAVVAAEFEARVAKILVTSGQRVRTGDPLAALDDSQLRQRVEAARHAEEAAHAKMLSQGALVANTRRRLAIEERLYARGAQAREAVTSARFELSSNGAGAAAARAEYQAASSSRVELEQQLAKAVLVAPMDGVVTVIKVKEGEIARSGTKIARVFDPQDLRVQFELPRQLRGEVAIGSTVEVLVDGLVLHAPVVEVSADLEPPLQFAIATADVIDDEIARAVRVGAEVRVLLPAPGVGRPAPIAQVTAVAPPVQVAAAPVVPTVPTVAPAAASVAASVAAPAAASAPAPVAAPAQVAPAVPVQVAAVPAVAPVAASAVAPAAASAQVAPVAAPAAAPVAPAPAIPAATP